MSTNDINRELTNPVLADASDLFRSEDKTKIGGLVKLSENLQNFPIKEDGGSPNGAYTIQTGDTVSNLARKLGGVTWQELLKMNNLTEQDARSLQPGRSFLIPRGMGIKTKEDLQPAFNNKPLYTPEITEPNYGVYGKYADEVKLANDENRIWFNEDVRQYQTLKEVSEGFLLQSKQAGGHIDLTSPLALRGDWLGDLDENRNNLFKMAARKKDKPKEWTAADETAFTESVEKFKGHFDEWHTSMVSQPIVMKTLRNAPKIKMSELLKTTYNVSTNAFNEALHLQHQYQTPAYLKDSNLTFDSDGALQDGSTFDSIMGTMVSDDYDPWVHVMTYDTNGMGLEFETPLSVSEELSDDLRINHRYHPNPGFYESDKPQLADKEELKQWFQAALQMRDAKEKEEPGSGSAWLDRIAVNQAITSEDWNTVAPNLYGAMAITPRHPLHKPYRAQNSNIKAIDDAIPDRNWVVPEGDILDEPRAYYAGRMDSPTGLPSRVKGFIDPEAGGVELFLDKDKNTLGVQSRYGRLQGDNLDRSLIYLNEEAFSKDIHSSREFSIQEIINHELRHVSQEHHSYEKYGGPSTPGQVDEMDKGTDYSRTSVEVGAWLTHAMSQYRQTKHVELGNKKLDPIDWAAFREWYDPKKQSKHSEPVNQFMDRIEEIDAENNSTGGVDALRHRIAKDPSTPQGHSLRRFA